MDRRAIDAITASQLSLIATRQFYEAGGTPEALRWAVSDGWLEHYRWRGVYAVSGSEPDDYWPLMGATLAAGCNSAAAGLGAAWVYGVPEVAPGALEIVVFNDREVTVRGVRARRSTLEPDGLIRRVHSVPVVVPALCVVQVAQTHSFLAELVANHLVVGNHTNFAAILKCLDAVNAHGRGSKFLRRLCLRELEIAGHDDSPPARKLGRSLLRAGIPPFETQYKVDTPDGEKSLDFAWPAAKVGLEYNGWRDHGRTQAASDRDARRRACLAAVGWRIIDATKVSSHAEIARWVEAALASPDEGVS